MSDDEILEIIRDELGRLAPEVEFDAVARNQPIQREFDIDSMDFLNYITALHERLGVNVPEADYVKVATIEGAQAYVAQRLRAQSS